MRSPKVRIGPEIYPGAIWSLWVMLNSWGYNYLHIGLVLAYSEVELERFKNHPMPGVLASPPIKAIEANHPSIEMLYRRCDTILDCVKDQDLGTIPRNVEILKAKILAARKRNPLANALSIDELIQDVTRLKNDFAYMLDQRQFYYLKPELSKYYGQVEMCGPQFTKKFPKARTDVERAGNCLALGESTAAILHLVRAMDLVTRTLGRKLKVTISPKSTWGTILGTMDDKIKTMPDATHRQKKKKSRWSECRAQLFHVKQAWRDDSVHTERSYDEKEARQILDRMKEFMEHLATL